MEVELKEKLDKSVLSTSVLLGNAKLLDESSRQTPVFLDSRHFPFYYHLGSFLKPESVLQIGTVGGLPACCFLQGCKTVKLWMSLTETRHEVVPRGIIRSNTVAYFKGDYFHFIGNKDLMRTKASFCQWDLGLLTARYENDDTIDYLDMIWDNLKPGGLLVMDYVNQDGSKEAFDVFCEVKNRKSSRFDTRYGIGMMEK